MRKDILHELASCGCVLPEQRIVEVHPAHHPQLFGQIDLAERLAVHHQSEVPYALVVITEVGHQLLQQLVGLGGESAAAYLFPRERREVNEDAVLAALLQQVAADAAGRPCAYYHDICFKH